MNKLLNPRKKDASAVFVMFYSFYIIISHQLLSDLFQSVDSNRYKMKNSNLNNLLKV